MDGRARHVNSSTKFGVLMSFFAIKVTMPDAVFPYICTMLNTYNILTSVMLFLLVPFSSLILLPPPKSSNSLLLVDYILFVKSTGRQNAHPRNEHNKKKKNNY